MKIPPRDIAAQINRVAGGGLLPPAKDGECATCRRCACQCEELRVDDHFRARADAHAAAVLAVKREVIWGNDPVAAYADRPAVDADVGGVGRVAARVPLFDSVDGAPIVEEG